LVINFFYVTVDIGDSNTNTDGDLQPKKDFTDYLATTSKPLSTFKEKDIYSTWGDYTFVDIGSTTKPHASDLATAQTFGVDEVYGYTLNQVINYNKGGNDESESIDLKNGQIQSELSSTQKFDVTGDGKPETIAYFCAKWRNHPCYTYIYILKDGKVMASSHMDGNIEDLMLTTDGNGFYLKELTYDGDAPMCCASGYTTTKFIYKDGKFVPVEETETLFAKIVNSVSKEEQ
jgi:hypothetical protein